MTREQWLIKLIDKARPMFKALDAQLPEVRAAICPPHARKSKKIGLCWHENSSEDGAREIWVSSEISDAFDVAGVLMHELCHAALPGGVGHKKPFIKLARGLHLEGKPTATVVGEPFKKIWFPILEKIGPLPGAKFLGLRPLDGSPKQATRPQRNVSCPDCGFAAKVFLDQMKMGRLKCPADRVEMLMKCEMEEDED